VIGLGGVGVLGVCFFSRVGISDCPMGLVSALLNEAGYVCN
jgi:hypothetical protein